MADSEKRPSRQPTIQQTVRRAFMRAALLPLFCIELSFLLVYWITISLSNQQSVDIAKSHSYQDLQLHTSKIAKQVETQLRGVSMLTRTFAGQATYIFNDHQSPLPPQPDNLELSSDGVYHTSYDTGGSAVYYSGIVPVGEKEREKVRRTSRLDPIMKSIYLANPLISQVYFNTQDSYNRIYPFINVLKTYQPKMNIPSYSFYYLADLEHNPLRDVTWTDAYLDPAGSGWMISAIAPVYSKQKPNKLEAVVGLDITLASLVRELLTSHTGLKGSAMILNQNGSIVAMPRDAEEMLDLQELTVHHYQNAVSADNFKPDEFNILNREDTRKAISSVLSQESGVTEVHLHSSYMLSWAKIAETNWHLLYWAPMSQIEQQYLPIKTHMTRIGWLMVSGLVLFYALFFWYLDYQARLLGDNGQQQLTRISNLVESIGRGNYQQRLPEVKMLEMELLARLVIRMGRRLGEAYNAVAKAEYHAGHDKLTTLPNRYLMEEHLSHSIELAKRDKQQLAVLFVDLNRFKAINDTLGHAVGDIVLKTVASRITSKLRHSDVVARFGGDEFVVILNDVHREQDIQVLVDTIKHTISIPVEYHQGCCQITSSIGYALYPRHGQDSQSLIIYADAEMYKQKPAQGLDRLD